MIKLELTPDEANTLAGVIDLAVKAGGIRTAIAAIVIFHKLEAAVKELQTEPKGQE